MGRANMASRARQPCKHCKSFGKMFGMPLVGKWCKSWHLSAKHSAQHTVDAQICEEGWKNESSQRGQSTGGFHKAVGDSQDWGGLLVLWI